MKQFTEGRSSSPLTIEHIDWDTYAHLQKVRRLTHNPFKIEALEHALEKAIEPQTRAATGIKLAEDLFRDGRRKELQKYNPNSHFSKRFAEYEYFHETFSEPSPSLEANFKRSLSIVKAALSSLPPRYAVAIYLKFAGLDNAEGIRATLNVGLKQYSNILKQARTVLNDTAGFDDAFFLLILHAEEADLIHFFKKTIKKHLLLFKAA